MEKIFIKETIEAVDYKNDSLGLLYTTSKVDISGGIININLVEDVGGWYQLTFDVPAFIIEEGKQVDNPILKNIFPLSKIKYTQKIKVRKSSDSILDTDLDAILSDGEYEEEEMVLYFIVQPQTDTRDENGIVIKSFTCVDYPRHVLSKTKNGITIGEDTLDAKRSRTPNNELPNIDGKVYYIKAPVQKYKFSSYEEISTATDALPGAIAFAEGEAYRLVGTDPVKKDVNNPDKFLNWHQLKEKDGVYETCIIDETGQIEPLPVWCPDWGAYPYIPENLEEYIKNEKIGEGVEGFNPNTIQFYWDTVWFNPEKTLGRYEGVLFRERSRLLYDLFQKTSIEFPENFLGSKLTSEALDKDVSSYLEGKTAYAYVIETDSVWMFADGVWQDTHKTRKEFFPTRDILGGKWSKLDPVLPRLAPNFAEPYLDYILEGTGWSVGEVDKIMVEDGTVRLDDKGTPIPQKVELSTYLDLDNSNPYNAISELSDAFKCYPRFDHINKTVSLKAVPGDDNGLNFRWRSNLKSSSVVQDGEKAVSKLWVYGGEDLDGKVSIQDCNRVNPKYFLGQYDGIFTNLTPDMHVQYFVFPKEVTLRDKINTFGHITFEGVNASSGLNGGIDYDKNIVEFSAYIGVDFFHVVYHSSNGVYFKRDVFIKNNPSTGDVELTNPVDLGDKIKITSLESWNDSVGYFILGCDSAVNALYAENPQEGQYANIVKTSYTWKDLTRNRNISDIPTVKTLKDLPSTGEIGDAYYVETQYSYYVWLPENNSWYDTFLDAEPENTENYLSFETRYDYTNGKWNNIGQFYHWWEPLSPVADNYIMDFSYFLDRRLITQEQIDDIKYNYILPISHLNKKRWPLVNQYISLNRELMDWNNTYDSSKISRDAIDKSLRTTYVIYEKKQGESANSWKLKELDVNAYPPGADFKTLGWTQTNIAYAESDAPEVPTYADIKQVIPNPVIGQYVKVSKENIVYYYSGTYSFNDTICAYLGWEKDKIKDTKTWASLRKDSLLYNPDANGNPISKKDVVAKATLMAVNRGEGLFEALREKELFGDPERASLANWYNPPTNPNDLPEGPVSDPNDTSNKNAYYDARERYMSEQLRMSNATEKIAQIETQITFIEQKIKALEETIGQIEAKLKERYGDYIVEGEFSDETMVWPYNLWYAGLKALELYHRPLITYNLGVLDASGLPEYTTMTTDVYHDIVYLLNKPELVLPSAGDYCYITDEKLGIIKEKANITSISRNLTNPANNNITIATVDTNTEDLISKLVNAANTIYSKEQIYNRSAIIKKDGTIAEDNLSNSLEDNSGKINVVSNSGVVVLGDNGIVATDKDDNNIKMKYTGKGVFASNNGGKTWDNILSGGKLSTKAISAGTLDSNTVSISNIGHSATITIDGKGIKAINYDGIDASSGTSLTEDEKKNTSFFLDSQNGNAYFAGTVEAGAGNIAGWKIEPSALTKNGVGMSSNDSSSTNIAFWAGDVNAENAPFRVLYDGSIYAKAGTFEGKIDSSNVLVKGGDIDLGNGLFHVDKNGSLTATSGVIGGWSLTSRKLYATGDNDKVAAIQAPRDGMEWVFAAGGTSHDNYSDCPFRVSKGGALYATGATIKGEIQATSGSIGGWTIGTDGKLKGKNDSVVLKPDGTIWGEAFYFDSNQQCYIIQTPTGTAGKSLIYLSTNPGYFVFGGNMNKHPYVSGLNVSSSNSLYLVDGTNASNPGNRLGGLTWGIHANTQSLLIDLSNPGSGFGIKSPDIPNPDKIFIGQSGRFFVQNEQGIMKTLRFEYGLLVGIDS